MKTGGIIQVQKCRKCGHVYAKREIIGGQNSLETNPFLMTSRIFESPTMCTICGGDVVWTSESENLWNLDDPFLFTKLVLRCSLFGILGYFLGVGIAHLIDKTPISDSIGLAGFFIAIPIGLWLTRKRGPHRTR